ncbi:MAG: YitT family protein, partial [Mycoplasma sp.]|nr:YitT family protein [Mycoplasma sp.]
MSKFYKQHKSWVFLTLAGLLYFVSINVFVSTVGIFTMGLMAFSNMFYYVLGEGKNIPFFKMTLLVNFILNIPLLIGFWFKLKKIFLIKTTYFLLIQVVLSLISQEIMNIQTEDMVKVLYGSKLSVDEFRNKKWTIFIYSIIGASFSSIGAAFSWKYGGSTAGGDIVVYYLSYKYKKSISSISLFVSLIFLAISFIVSLVFEKPENIKENWLIILTSTLAYLIINIGILNYLYPKYSKVKLEIVSNKSEKIDQYFKESRFIHSW